MKESVNQGGVSVTSLKTHCIVEVGELGGRRLEVEVEQGEETWAAGSECEVV